MAAKARKSSTPYSLFIAACKAQSVALYWPVLDDGARGAGCTADNPGRCTHDPHGERSRWRYSGDGRGTWKKESSTINGVGTEQVLDSGPVSDVLCSVAK